jgi:hypothetical protein
LAIWQLEFPTSTNAENWADDPIGAANDPVSGAEVEDWINKANTAVANGYRPDSTFFIPAPAYSTTQRFVAISETPTPGTLDLLPAPEPGTLGLMGAGLLGLAGILRRKLRR